MKKIFILLSFILSGFGLMSQSASISGRITKVDDQPMPGVTVQALDDSGAIVAAVQTNGAGEFVLSGLPIGATYTIQPLLDVWPLNGVSTFDMILGARHILGLEPLDNPYYILAGDVNNSQNLTTYDLVIMRQVILQLADAFSDSPSWRFYRNDMGFLDPSNPWMGYMGGVNFVQLNDDLAGFDFIGGKMGDLNGDAQP